jgi:hypothetical protein
VLPEEQTESDGAPRSLDVPLSDSERIAPSQPRRPFNASTTSVASITTSLPGYSASITTIPRDYSDAQPEEQTESDGAPRSLDVPLSDSEPVAPSQPRRPFRPLPQIPLPQIPLSRSSSRTQSSRPPRYSISERLSGGSEPHIEHSFPLGGPNSWATLYTFTPESIPGLIHDFRSAKRNIPTFIEGRNVLGMLEFDLEAPQTVQQIIVTVCLEVFAHDSSRSKGPIHRSKVQYSLDLWPWKSKSFYSISTTYGTSHPETRDSQLRKVTEGFRGHISSPSLSHSQPILTAMHTPISKVLCLHSLWRQALSARIPRHRYHQLPYRKSYDLRPQI